MLQRFRLLFRKSTRIFRKLFRKFQRELRSVTYNEKETNCYTIN